MSNLLEQASLVMIPSGYKEDVVYSEIPLDGSGDLSFTRASNGTRINSAGLVEVAPWNLLQESESIGVVSPWSNSNLTITANSVIAPNGTTTADVLTETTATTTQFRTQQTTPQSTNIYTLSVYVKNITGTRQAYIDLGPVTGFFNFATETIYSASAIGSFEKLANSWYRIALTTANPITPSTIYLGLGQNNSETYTGNGTSAIAFWGAQLNIGSTAKPYFPTTDRLNVPRLTYQNGGGGCPSLLLEKQSTNLFPNSQTTANWSFSNMSRTANYGISPDGTQNADLLFPTTSGSVTFQSDITTSSLVIGQPFVVSFFIKLNASFTSDAGTNILDIRLSGPTVWSRPTVRINLETGAVTNINNAIYISSTNFGNGWFRITFGATPTGTSGQVALQSPTSLTMNGGSFYIWGLQGEANATYATSYIPTTSSSATRVADACSKTGISSLIGQTEGTMFAEIRIESGSTEFRVISINDGTTSNRVALAINGQTDIRGFSVYGSTVGTAITTSIPSGAIKIAIVYTATNYTFFVNGSKIGTQTKGSFATTLTNLSFDQGNGGNSFFGQDKQLILFPTPLTDAECQALTTI